MKQFLVSYLGVLSVWKSITIVYYPNSGYWGIYLSANDMSKNFYNDSEVFWEEKIAWEKHILSFDLVINFIEKCIEQYY